MSLKLSTNFRNTLLAGGDLRKTFEDAIITIYSGSAPATADAAATGTPLVIITKSQGTVTTGEVSTSQEASILVGSHALNETFTFINDGVSYTYTNNPDLNAIAIAATWANIINAAPGIDAMASGAVTIYVRSKYKGVLHVWSLAGTGTTNGSTGAHALVDTVSNVTVDTIRFGVSTSGALSKDAATWSGPAIATGVAGYFRITNSADVGAIDSVHLLFPRLQGSVGISGTEMTISNTTITSGAVQTIDTATITMPAS